MQLAPWIHFTIDGVIKVFKEIYEKRPASVFEHAFFKGLKELHELYGINVTLYVIEHMEIFYLNQLQAKYWEELREHTWIKYGWHGEQIGKLSIDVQQEVASCCRVTELLISYLGKSAIDQVGCKYQYCVAPELQKEYAVLGITTLLVSDHIEEQKHLSCEQIVCLEENHWCPPEPEQVAWKTRDFCFDKVEEDDIKRVVNRTKELVTKYIIKEVEIFASEREFLKNPTKMKSILSNYFQSFIEEEIYKELKAPLYPIAGSVIENRLFFCCFNDEYLYVLDLDTKKVDVFLRISQQPFLALKIVHYGDKLFLIPYVGTEIIIVNYKNKEVRNYKLPVEKKAKRSFGLCTQEGNKVWMLSYDSTMLVEYNLEEEKHRIYADIMEKAELKYSAILLHEDWLYLFSNPLRGSEVIRYHTKTREKEVWSGTLPMAFGMIHNNVLYGMCSTAGKAKMSAINLHTKVQQEWIENFVVEEKNLIPYLGGINYGDRLFFLPFHGDSLIELDIGKQEINQIQLILKGYFPREHKLLNYSVKEGKIYNNELVLIPNMNNVLALVDMETKVIEKVQLVQSAREYYKKRAIKRMFEDRVCEEETFKLKELIKFCSTTTVENELMQRNRGKEIIEILGEQ